jgi:hypothetical protein
MSKKAAGAMILPVFRQLFSASSSTNNSNNLLFNNSLCVFLGFGIALAL